jgi:hypothetical protein
MGSRPALRPKPELGPVSDPPDGRYRQRVDPGTGTGPRAYLSEDPHEPLPLSGAGKVLKCSLRDEIVAHT